jgi:hypothetical protein
VPPRWPARRRGHRCVAESRQGGVVRVGHGRVLFRGVTSVSQTRPDGLDTARRPGRLYALGLRERGPAGLSLTYQTAGTSLRICECVVAAVLGGLPPGSVPVIRVARGAALSRPFRVACRDEAAGWHARHLTRGQMRLQAPDSAGWAVGHSRDHRPPGCLSACDGDAVIKEG